MSLDNCYRAYGRYLVTFNRLGPLLDAAIVRESGVGPVQGAILVSGFTPRSRVAVLRGLMAAAGGEKGDVVPMLTELAQEAKKQTLLQGVAQPGGTNSLQFLRPDAQGRAGAAASEFTAEQMDALSDELTARIDALVDALKIGPTELTALKRANEDLLARRRRSVPAAMEEDAD